MNILIVDDEVYAVRAIQRSMNWAELGIDQVYTAFNMSQAKEVFKDKKVDIIVTDIEMPGSSGLDLLEWVRDCGYDCEAICLTGHAEFRYAQRAMQYDVMDYVIKPVNFTALSDVLKKAVNRVQETIRKKAQQTKGVLWDHNKDQIENTFWEALINGMPMSPVYMQMQAENVHIDYDVNAQHMLVLFAVRQICDRQEEWEVQPDIMQFIIYNIARDGFLQDRDAAKWGWKQKYMWAILSPDCIDNLYDKLESFLDVCASITGAKMVAYMDTLCFGEELHTMYQKLEKADYQNVSFESGVMNLSLHHESVGEDFSGKFVSAVKKFLHEKKFAQLSQYVESVRAARAVLERKKLFMMIEEIRKELYIYLERNHILVEYFWTDALLAANDSIYQSVENFLAWILQSIDRLKTLDVKKEDKDIISQIKHYIRDNIYERISREQIAEHVNFSVDYISRIFKKETGISLSEYIMHEKIEAAKAMMDAGDENIGNIASCLGYNSFSYFTEVFKRITGVLPRDYKRQQINDKITDER